MSTLATAVILAFLNPHGAGNDVIANSSQLFASPARYETVQQCEKASMPDFKVMVNDAKTDFYFTGTKACFETVPADQAGAWLTIWKASQNTGVRVQYDGQMIFLPIADADTCKRYMQSLNAIEPAWETDLPLVLSGACI